MITKIAEYVGVIAIVVGGVVYAENEYAKQDSVQKAMTDNRQSHYQDKINYLNYLKSQGELTPAQKWELDYFTDKRNNLR